MRISYFITHFPYKEFWEDAEYFRRYKHGGAEVAAYYLALEMAKQHEVSVFTTSINSKDSFEEYDGVSVYRYGTKIRIEKGNLSLGLFMKSLNHHADIVHAHFSTPPAEIAGARCAKKKKLPFVLTYHGDWQESFGGFVRKKTLSLYGRFLIHKVLSQANVIILPSEYYITESRFLGKFEGKVIVIPNGIDSEDFEVSFSKIECRNILGLPAEKNIIMFVGNLVAYKGPDVLTKAIALILREIPQALLVFVGGGNMMNKLREVANETGVSDYVRFEGVVGEGLKPLYYKAADVFCLPSNMNTEVFPIVLLEASVVGLPMVVSDLATFKCIVQDGFNGILTKRNNEVDLANALIYLLRNEDKRKTMGENARKKVQEFSWNRIAETTEKLYQGLLNEDMSSCGI